MPGLCQERERRQGCSLAYNESRTKISKYIYLNVLVTRAEAHWEVQRSALCMREDRFNGIDERRKDITVCEGGRQAGNRTDNRL
jgi:hypothetical protein